MSAETRFSIIQQHKNQVLPSEVVLPEAVLPNETLKIQVQPNVDFVLLNNQTGYAPATVLTTREGQALKIELYDGDDEADIQLENYYAHPENKLIGKASDDQFYAYMPKSGNQQDAVPLLADSQAAEQTLENSENTVMPFWLWDNFWVFGLVAPLALIADYKKASNNQASEVPLEAKTEPNLPITEESAVESAISPAVTTEPVKEIAIDSAIYTETPTEPVKEYRH